MDPSMRASDDDRETVAGRLRDAHAEGRLTMEEFEERLDATYAAKTQGELVAVTQDLPAVPAPFEAPTSPLPARPTPYVGRGHVRRLWAAWATAVFVNVAIWGAISVGSGPNPYFWPIWVAGPWGAVLLARTLFGTERPGRRDECDHH